MLQTASLFRQVLTDGPLRSLRRRTFVRGDGMCAALRSRAKPGTWLYPNSGVYLSTLRGMRALLERLRQLVLEGHFEDQGMMGLALLQHPQRSILIDSNATIFSSQYGYNPSWWTRPACFHDYFDARGDPPAQKLTGSAPFAMHFNGPAGRHRLGWCMAAFQRRCSRSHQYYVDLDAGGQHVELPRYCDPTSAVSNATVSMSTTIVLSTDASSYHQHHQLIPPWAAAKGAAPPVNRTPVTPTSTRCESASQPRMRCINDRCFTFSLAR